MRICSIVPDHPIFRISGERAFHISEVFRALFITAGCTDGINLKEDPLVVDPPVVVPPVIVTPAVVLPAINAPVVVPPVIITPAVDHPVINSPVVVPPVFVTPVVIPPVVDPPVVVLPVIVTPVIDSPVVVLPVVDHPPLEIADTVQLETPEDSQTLPFDMEIPVDKGNTPPLPVPIKKRAIPKGLKSPLISRGVKKKKKIYPCCGKTGGTSFHMCSNNECPTPWWHKKCIGRISSDLWLCKNCKVYFK